MNTLKKAKLDRASVYLNQDFGFEKIDDKILNKLEEKINPEDKILLLAATGLIKSDGNNHEEPMGKFPYNGGLVVLQDSLLFVGHDLCDLQNPFIYLQVNNNYITGIEVIEAFTKKDIVVHTKDKSYFFTNLEQNNIDDMLMKLQQMKDYVKPMPEPFPGPVFPPFPDSTEEKNTQEDNKQCQAGCCCQTKQTCAKQTGCPI